LRRSRPPAPRIWRGFSRLRPSSRGPPSGALRLEVTNPATGALVGHVLNASAADTDTALRLAEPWAAAAPERAAILHRAADLYEENFGPFFALLAREAGKTAADAVSELREAVDFLRYYAGGGRRA